MEPLAHSLAVLMLGVFGVLIFSGYPVALVLTGIGIAFCLIGYFVDVFPLIAFYNVPLRIYGSISSSFIYPAIPMLLFMGVAFEKSGVAREMLLCLQLLLRWLPGRLAVAVTVLGILLGPLPGLIGTSVATLALVALPTMLAQRYRPSLAASSVAAAGTLSVIIPPSVMLFFLATQFGIPMGYLFLATMVPALTLAGLYLVYYVGRCAFDPRVAPGAPPERENPREPLLLYVVRSLALPVGLIAMVLGSFIFGWATPTQSATVGAMGGLGLMVLNRQFSFRRLHEVVVATTLMTSMVFFIVMAAGVFSYPFRYFEGDDVIASVLQGVGLGDWGTLVLILTLIFLLGFVIDWIEITVITLPIFLPVLETLKFADYVGHPDLVFVWMAVLVALVLQTSFLTPPFGFALFFLKGAAPPGVRLADIYRGVVPLVAIQLLTVVLVMFLPMLAVWLPARLLG